MKKIIVTPNGTQEIELTTEEISQKEIDTANATARKQEEEQAKTQKEADALAGNNKLLELGLTQAQVTAMTGYTPPTEV
jgi:hypothetical protein